MNMHYCCRRISDAAATHCQHVATLFSHYNIYAIRHITRHADIAARYATLHCHNIYYAAPLHTPLYATPLRHATPAMLSFADYHDTPYSRHFAMPSALRYMATIRHH